jgi:hypothetical protein
MSLKMEMRTVDSGKMSIYTLCLRQEARFFAQNPGQGFYFQHSTLVTLGTFLSVLMIGRL